MISDRTEARMQKLILILTDFARINVAVLIILLMLRVGQNIYFSYFHTLPPGSWGLGWKGFLNDLVIWQFIAWGMFLPVLFLSLWKRWIGNFLSGLVFFLFIALEWGLFRYFTVTFVPLDEVIFSYSLREMTMITQHSIKISVFSFFPFFLFGLVTIISFLFILRIRFPKYITVIIFVFSGCGIVFSSLLIPHRKDFRNPSEYFFTVNKTAYFIHKCNLYLSGTTTTSSDAEILSAVDLYQSLHPEFDFVGKRYPLLHYDNTPDVLSPFFRFNSEKPNIVFLICESLSSCFSGNNNIFGSYTPFLDSLSAHSLYWPNFLSTADRTFNVLQAMMASLPPGDPTFVNYNKDAQYPYHLSLIRYLEETGYFSSFFYSGDPTFNNMEDFLKRQNIDFILKDFGEKYRKIRENEGYGWGYPDGDLFKRSFEVINSQKRSPRLDIYLTLSTHPPFTIPDQDHYLSLVEERMKKASPELIAASDVEKYKNIFASVLYLDNSIREFMENYRKRPEFNNTIFIITGDHAMGELNLYRFSMIEVFHVPFIIYSPMLKQNEMFHSVSTHLDVTPTLLSMLKKSFGIQTDEVVSWMGSGIDTARDLRNTNILPFILNNKEIPLYLNKSYFLSPYNVTTLEKGFWLKEIKDHAIRRRLTDELESFKILNIHVARKNRLIPPEIYFGKVLLNEPVNFENQVPFSARDSVWEYRSFYRDLVVSSKYKLLKFDLSVDFMIDSRGINAPLLVFDFPGKEKQRQLYSAFDLFGDSLKNAVPGQWKTARIVEYIDLNYIKEKSDHPFLMYLWNKNRSVFKVANPKVEITGYY